MSLIPPPQISLVREDSRYSVEIEVLKFISLMITL